MSFDLEMGGMATPEEIAAEQAAYVSPGLSWWDSLKESVVPESYGESVVNAIYSTPGNTLKPDPAYNVEDLSSPNVYVKAKGAITEAASALTGFGGKALMYAAVFVLVAVAVYALVPALVRR